MDINKFAKQNDLARKFEKAIEAVDRGNGWGIFTGLDKGEVTVKVALIGGAVHFRSIKKPKKAKKTPPPYPEPKTTSRKRPETE